MNEQSKAFDTFVCRHIFTLLNCIRKRFTVFRQVNKARTRINNTVKCEFDKYRPQLLQALCIILGSQPVCDEQKFITKRYFGVF